MLQRLFLGVVALACLLLLGRPAAADKGLLLEAAPVLGPSVPSGAAWFSVSVRVDNTTDAQIEGNLELTAELSFSREEAKVLTRAPFAVGRASRKPNEPGRKAMPTRPIGRAWT